MKYHNLGLKLEHDIISVDEEKLIIDSIEQFKRDNPKLVANYGDFNLHSIYFGERYKNKLSIPEPILDVIKLLISKDYFDEVPFGVAINTYKKGQKIGAHIDKTISGPIVTILSLNSDATMIFKKSNEKDISIDLEPRSIVQMKDEIRNEWTHEILPVKNLRYSIVFRSQC